MNKKKDLKLVFEFIADFLKEDVDSIPVKPTKMSEPKVVKEDKEAVHILDIMKRLDDIDKAKGNAIRIMKSDENIKNDLQKQLQDLRSEHSLKISKDTISEEEELGIPVSISPLNEMQERLNNAKQTHEELKTEIKASLGLDMNNIVRPMSSKSPN